MRILLHQTALEIKFLTRRRDELFWVFVFPVFFIVLFGLIYGEEMWEDIRAIDYLLPGIIVMALMTTGIMNTTTGFVEERAKGIYRRLSVTPLKKQSIIGAQLIKQYLVILAQSIILIVIGILVFNIDIVGNYATFWLILTLGGICFLTIGFALTVLIRTAKSATPLTMIVFFILLFLGGVFFPIDIMPTGLDYVSNVLPSTHVNDALRLVAIEGKGIGDAGLNLLVIGGWTIVCLVLSVRFFRWE
jgi:ABC-2 type transport system permease protein